MKSSELLAVAVAAAVGTPSAHGASPSNATAGHGWHHKWTTGHDMWFADFGYSTLTDEQAAFVASHYSVVSLEKCTGSNVHMMTEPAIYQTAKQLKKLNPQLKVIFYWDTDQGAIGCYAANKTLNAHPEWWLKQDNGSYVPGPRIDFSVQAAADWWVSVPLDPQWGDPKMIDGVLADGAGYGPIPGVSTARAETFYSAKKAAMAKMQAKYTALNGGIVMGNGLNMYGGANANPGHPHDLDLLDSVGAVMNEHYAVFESVNAHNHSLNLEMVKTDLAIIEQAASDLTKNVFVSTWPGLFVGFGKDGFPLWPQGGESQPVGNDGWRKALSDHFMFAFASVLTVAGPNVYMTYGVWYELHQGYVSCPEAPESCCTPLDYCAPSFILCETPPLNLLLLAERMAP